MTQKPSFFERLTGSVPADEVEPEETTTPQQEQESQDWMEEETTEGELAVDVYETPDDVIVKAMIAGVKPDDLDVSITRDIVTIEGNRQDDDAVYGEGYQHQELYWGSFSRTILLPKEIEPEEAEASEKHGLLLIHLPKVDRKKERKLKVKTS